MKRLITLFAAVAFAAQTWAYDFKSDKLYYNITSDTTVEVTYEIEETPYSKQNYSRLTQVSIPQSVTNDGKTYSVTSIGEKAFMDCEKLTSVTMQGSITSISGFAFNNCSNLSSVVIPNSVTSIEAFAFCGCGSLTSITIPNSVTNIGLLGAFKDCTSLIEITIPDGVTKIAQETFSGCSSLASITIPESVIKIENKAFYGCKSLTSITIPDGVTSIEMETFCGCSNLTSITIPELVWSIGSRAFWGCSKLTSVTIPELVKSINRELFYGCKSLTSITIPDGVTSIGEDAFTGCSSLSSINVDEENPNYTSEGGVLFNKNKSTIILCPEGKSGEYVIPASVRSIGKCAFYGCSSITTINIPDSVKSIGASAFYKCVGLTSIAIPDSVKSIGARAFYGCVGLTSITISDGVKSIGSYAFYDCIGLKTVTIPFSVAEIGVYALYGVKNIVYSGNAEGRPWGALNDDGLIDGDFIYSDAGETKLTAYIGEGGDVVIPETVTSIGRLAFYNCSNITTINIPIAVDSIGAYAFDGCTATIYCEASSKPSGWSYDWNRSDCPVVWTDHTPVTEFAANAVSIYACGKNIVVENSAEEIRVYDAMGKLICRDAINRVRTEIPVNTTGVYIVKVGNIAKRVVIN